METYDPLNAPDLDEWQSMDEDERITLVTAYHREAGVDVPGEQAHVAIHVIVENQIALGDEIPIRATVARLAREGLDRHEAIHAVGGVLAGLMQELVGGGDEAPAFAERYYEELEKLTAAHWLESFR